MDRCVRYCLQDCRVNDRLFDFLLPHITNPKWKESLRLEHDTAILCQQLQETGFKFDAGKAEGIRTELSRAVRELGIQLQESFRPRSFGVRRIVPKSTKFGTLNKTDFRWLADGDLTSYSEGHEFSVVGWEEFNPSSPKQVVERLNEAGWEPTEKTKGAKENEKTLQTLRRSFGKGASRSPEGRETLARLEEKSKYYETYGWTVSEENLETLPEDAPEGTQHLVKHRMLSKRLQVLEEWFDAYNIVSGRIHGNFSHIGTWTHRKSHSGPNMGNVPSMDSKYHSKELKELAKSYGKDMRSCWIVPEGKVLIGTDADGIQLRILAHYMNDPEFTQALVNGDKDAGTDAHTLNAIKLDLGAVGRPRAKTFIYAWLLGAGYEKVAKILGGSVREARDRVQTFIDGYPGLRRLKDVEIPKDAARGYFEGFDGRIIQSDEYHMLAGYLQAGESLVMKKAALRWHDVLKRDGIWFQQVNDVHDEYQTESDDDDEVVSHIQRIQCESITWAGEQYGLNCPLAGTSKKGLNWFETH